MAKVDEQVGSPWRSDGFRRLKRAASHQFDGVRHALAHDPAIRQVSIAITLLMIIAFLLPVARIERLLLLWSVMQIGLLEYVNSAIEATVDRISLEPHPLSKHAKDLASVAVGISVMMAILAWIMIVGPLLLTWLKFGPP